VPVLANRYDGVDLLGPITYVSRQLGRRDASITLRVYAHWVPDVSAMKAVDLLDDTQRSATQTQPPSRSAEWENALSVLGSVVSRDGIEPSTRRLRVASRSRKRSKSE